MNIKRENVRLIDDEIIKEDLKSMADPKSGYDFDKMATICINGLKNNDSFWEIYWMTLNMAIKEEKNEK